MQKEYTWLDTKYSALPDVVGMSLEEAQKTLKGYLLKYTGNGTNVTYQNPKAGYYVEDGSTVELLLN